MNAQKPAIKREEWERMLVIPQLSRDLPDEMRDLLRQLDEQLGVKKRTQD